MPATKLNAEQKKQLLDIAKNAIKQGLEQGKIQAVDLSPLDATLNAKGASFVSLHSNGELRGCMGKLAAITPLAQDVAENAFNAAFQDPRFLPLRPEELDQLEIEISILGPKQELHFQSEAELIQQLRPGIDGLVLEFDGLRGTFLPVVWQYYDQAKIFFDKLKVKAGLSENFWSPDLKCWRYETETFS